MATGPETALVKPVVDALLDVFTKAKTYKLKSDAEKALYEAIRELLLAEPNLFSVEARIRITKAAGIINDDLVVAEEMMSKVRTPLTAHIKAAKFAVKKAPDKKLAVKKAKPAAQKAVKTPPAKKVAAKKAKPAAKQAMKKAPAKKVAAQKAKPAGKQAAQKAPAKKAATKAAVKKSASAKR